MGTPRSIPAEVEEALLTLAGELNPATRRRWTTRELSAWLQTTHAIRLSHAGVGAILRRARDERQAAVADAIRAQVCDNLTRQLQDLDALLAFYLQEARATDPETDDPPEGRAPSESRKQTFDPTRYARVFIQGLGMKLRFSGLGERLEVVADIPDRPESHRDELARRIAELNARQRESEDPGGDGGGAG